MHGGRRRAVSASGRQAGDRGQPDRRLPETYGPADRLLQRPAQAGEPRRADAGRRCPRRHRPTPRRAPQRSGFPVIIYKSEAEIDLMREAGAILAEALARLQTIARPGITLLELDREADRFIRGRGCIPGFVGYQGYQNAICTSVNDQVVHGIPTNRKLREGDLLSLDAGLIHRSFWADAGLTVGIGKISPEAQRLMDATRESLDIGIRKAQAGNRIGDISAAIQQHVEGAGFSVVESFVGHGIGRDMHEDPQVPNFGIAGQGPLLKPGMVLAIEPMVNAGRKDVALLGDGWTVVTVDHSLSAYFEHSVAITADGPEILTSVRKSDARHRLPSRLVGDGQGGDLED